MFRFLENLRPRTIVLLCMALYVAVVILNPGFMGTDEYWTGITRYIPAQNSQLHHLVGNDDVKSPVQILPMHLMAQLALTAGIESPYSQYHFVVIVLGLINFLVLLCSFLMWRQNLSEIESKILLLLLGFYFAAPFVFSRPMFESLSAPWLSLACLFAFRYDHQKLLRDLILGVLCISVSFLLRPQTGLCALVFLFLPLGHKRWTHLIQISLFGLCCLLLSGLPDYYLRGSWHYSIRALADYNFHHGHEYGDQPWTFYPLMIFAMVFAPLVLHRVQRKWLTDYLTNYRSLFLMLVLFVFLHSLFSQKFERFLIPILPCILILLGPWIVSMIQLAHQKRLYTLGLINGVLWFASSFQPAQNNIISMARFLDLHPEIVSVYRIDSTPEWIPEAFIRKGQVQYLDIKSSDLTKVALNCSDRVVLAQDMSKQPLLLNLPWVIETSFDVNWIEWLSYKLNPKNNLRRTQLTLWKATGCEG